MWPKIQRLKLSIIFSALFRFLIQVYQIAISPALHLFSSGAPGCRYYPCCSDFAKEVIDLHGIQGTPFIIHRILRCHPFSRAGFDPVPRAIEAHSHSSFSGRIHHHGS